MTGKNKNNHSKCFLSYLCFNTSDDSLNTNFDIHVLYTIYALSFCKLEIIFENIFRNSKRKIRP